MFLMTSMLLGLAAVGIPVVIHLLHRQRTTPVRWGAMQFLTESPLQHKRRKNVDHWLLMLLRMAAVALLVFALARPMLIEGADNPLGGGESTTDVAVVIDRTLSTSRRGTSGDDDGATPYERSVDALGAVVKGMRPSDTLTVVLAEHRPRVHSLRLSPPGAAVIAQQLRDLGPGLTGASIPEAIRAARETIADGRNPRRRIVVLSDEQRTTWAVDDAAAWQLATGKRAKVDDGLTIYTVPFAPGADAPNVAVTSVSVEPSLIGPGRVAQISTTVMNHGRAPVSASNVRFLVNGRAVDARQVPTLPPGESRTVRFEYAFAEPGSHHVSVVADATDALDADNAATVAVNALRELPVLIVDGQLSSAGGAYRASRFLRAAMQSSADARGDRAALVQPKVVSVSDAVDEPLDRYAVVVVNDAPRIPPALLAKIAERVRGGGGSAWFILGERADVDRAARDLGDAGLFAMTVKGKTTPPPNVSTAAATSPPAIDVRDPLHPSVRLITAAERNAFAGAATRGWWSVIPRADAAAHVVLATSTGDPLVLERAVGTLGGRVVVWTTGVDGGAWNNWPVLPHFVPLVNETLHHLASGQTRGLDNRQLAPGDDIVWTGPAEPRVSRATLTRPGGTTVDLTPRLVSNDRHVLSYNDTHVPGLYALRFAETAVPQPIYFGVGVDARELDPAGLTPADHRALAERGFVERRLSSPADLASAVVGGAGGARREVWPALAALVLLTLVAETFMTWRMVRHQAPGR